VSAALGKLDPHAFSQLRMRPDQGCVTLVSVRSFLLHTLGCSWFLRSGFFPPPFFRRWGGTSLPGHGSHRMRWTEQRGGSPRRRRRGRRTRRRPGPVSGGGLGTPWKSAIASRRGRDSRGSHRRKRPTTTTMMRRRRRTTWPPVSASAPSWGVARSRRASPRAGQRRQSPELGRRGPGPRHGGNPRGHLAPRRRQQEREGLPREPSPETPDDDDDDDDDEEEDDMAARLGLSPVLGCGQEPSSQPPSGPTPSVPGVGASGSRSEARGQPERTPDPSAGGPEVTPGGQVRASAPQEPPLVPAAHGGDPQVIVTVPGQSAPRVSKARVAPKLPAKRTSVAVLGAGIQETSPQARWIMARSG
jgi:hypothetical protein